MDRLPQFDPDLRKSLPSQPSGMVGSYDNDQNESTRWRHKQIGKTQVSMCVAGYFKRNKPFPLTDHGTSEIHTQHKAFIETASGCSRRKEKTKKSQQKHYLCEKKG